MYETKYAYVCANSFSTFCSRKVETTFGFFAHSFLILFSFLLFHVAPSELFVMPENTRRIEIKTSIRGRSGTYNLTVVAEDKMGINDSLDTVCSSKVPVQIRVDRSLNDAPQWLIPPTKNFSIDVLEVSFFYYNFVMIILLILKHPQK